MKEHVFRFRRLERILVESLPGARVLDIGCGAGDNLTRLRRYGGRPSGLDPSAERVHEATRIAPSVVGIAEGLPWPDSSFDMVYISHVLHHATDVDASLSEIERVLVPGGLLFLIETVDDSPLMRLARRLQPSWDDDEVLNRFRYDDLVRAVDRHGLTVRSGETFNWMYFAWELLPMAFRPFELLTPLFIGVEVALRRLLDRWGGHCWLVAAKPGRPVFPESALTRVVPLAAGGPPAPHAAIESSR